MDSASNNDIQHHCQEVLIRPLIQENDVAPLVQKLYGLKAKCVKQLNSYDDKNFFVEVLPECENPHIQNISATGYVLKVLNSVDSLELDIIEAQIMVLNSVSIPVVSIPILVKNVKGNFYSLESLGTSASPGQDSPKFLVRLFIFVPGKLMKEVPYTKELLHELGVIAAQLNTALEGISSAALANRKYRWHMESFLDCKQYLYVIKDPQNQELINEVFAAWSSVVVPVIPLLERGIIHSDLNEQNVLVSPENSNRICGLLDFGDLNRAPYIFELAIAIAYILVEVNTMEPDQAVSYVVAGYMTHKQISEEEWNILKETVAARFAQSLLIGAYTHSLNPDNSYLLNTAKEGWVRLRRMWSVPKTHLLASWKAVVS